MTPTCCQPAIRPTRRRVLAALLSTATAPALLGLRAAHAQEEGQPFSFDGLSERMRELAQSDPAPRDEISGPLTEIDYDDFNRIRFRADHIRWADDPSRLFRLNAFHLGWLFKEPVHMFELVDGVSRPMVFSTADFDYRDVKTALPPDLVLPGVAGFRLMAPFNRADLYDEVGSFLGASYFRLLGRGNRYGLSARGLAVNTGLSGEEEFPRFTEFYIERPAPGATTITLYAALQSDSVTGAYRFVITPGQDTTAEVTARLFFRDDIEQLGIAPLTSMYLFGGADPGAFHDFRPAVHDSDALVLTAPDGETRFRPVSNPPRLASSYLGMQSPASFGLVQRERDFGQFLDAESHYERRPTLIVEPMGDWGKGSVRLLEIPTKTETNDNIVAFWIPEAPAEAGGEMEFAYRLHWGMSPAGDGDKSRARVLRSRVGAAGVAGVEQKSDAQKFVIDFAGGALSELPANAEVVPVTSATRGEITQVVLSKTDEDGVWRLVVEATTAPGSSMEITARIEGFGQVLTETWLYQWMRQ
ncbi:glucan biosynthesis protein [Citreicella sp. C3M06]|uniref:glucan biosynthesis protein n=1 Tax=Citreicella sp. C3M06 TaxID=2841564 RepID=UPI00352C9957